MRRDIGSATAGADPIRPPLGAPGRRGGDRPTEASGSELAVARWQAAVDGVGTEVVVLPVHGIVDAVGAGVAPVAVEADAAIGGAGAAHAEEVAGGLHGHLAREGLDLGDGHGPGRGLEL